MKKNLKKYNDFINEELTAAPKLSDSYLKSNLDRNNAEIFLILRSNFYDRIINTTDDLKPRSFSDMCKKDSNPEEDYKELQSLMDKKGWDIQSIKNLFSNKVNKLCGYGIAKFVRGERTEEFQEVIDELENQGVSKEKIEDINEPFGSDLDSQNGHTDIYLYFLFKELGLNPNFISLGGEGWASYNEQDEMYIRYRYGYHQTKYGQLMLNQIGYTIEQFKEEALVYLQQDIKDNWGEMISSSVMRNGVINKVPVRRSDLGDNVIRNLTSFLRSSIQIEDYTLVEDDRMIIYSNEIANDINKAFPEQNTTSEDVSSGVVKYLEWAGTNIEVVDGDVIIWGKFKVDF
jgi:hypothetical protein